MQVDFYFILFSVKHLSKKKTNVTALILVLILSSYSVLPSNYQEEDRYD